MLFQPDFLPQTDPRGGDRGSFRGGRAVLLPTFVCRVSPPRKASISSLVVTNVPRCGASRRNISHVPPNTPAMLIMAIDLDLEYTYVIVCISYQDHLRKGIGYRGDSLDRPTASNRTSRQNSHYQQDGDKRSSITDCKIKLRGIY